MIANIPKLALTGSISDFYIFMPMYNLNFEILTFGKNTATYMLHRSLRT
jgi:hypothetical protein